MNLIYLMSLSFLSISVAVRDNVPLFVLDDKNILMHLSTETNPFTKMGPARFADLVHDTMRHSETIIVFTEETFCMEDITTKDSEGTPFVSLSREFLGKKTKFIPTVVHPFAALNKILQPYEQNSFQIGHSRSKPKIYNSRFKYFYVHFADLANETRVDALRRHDMIVKDIVTSTNEVSNGPVLAFYTGKINPTVIEAISYLPAEMKEGSPKLDGKLLTTSRGLFQLHGIHIKSPLRRSFIEQIPIIDEKVTYGDGIVTKFTFSDFQLDFNFSYKPYGWILDHVALMEGGEEVGRTVMQVGADWGSSYTCTDPLYIVNSRDGSVVSISRYQIELFKNFLRDGPEVPDGPEESEIAEKPTSFSDPVHCERYFSSQIMSGLFLVFIWLAILFFGLIMIMDCHSYDRYDDPQGKPINLGVAEKL